MEENQKNTNDGIIALSLVRIELTEEEARRGCTKSVVSGNQQYPIVIPAGTKLGDEFEIRSRNNALIGIVEVNNIIAGEKKEKRKKKTAPKETAETAGESGGKKSNPKLIAIGVAAAVVVALGIFAFTYFNHTVPDVSGLDADAAKAMIEYAGLTYEEDRQFSDDVPRGDVISQEKEANSHLRKGAPVVVVISKGKPIPAPGLVGMSFKDAEKNVKDLGLAIEVASEEFSDTLGKDKIISQDIEEKTECEAGQVINVVKSKGITQVEVPDVTNKTVDEATAALENEGFKVAVEEAYSSSAAGTIVGQSVEGGKTADKGSTITISKSIGPKPVSKSSSRKKKKPKKKKSGSSSWGDGDW